MSVYRSLRLVLGRATLLVLVVVLLGSCASAGMESPRVEPIALPDPEVAELVGGLSAEVQRFDDALVTAQDGRCDALCEHKDAICTIAGRICELAAQRVSDGNAAACHRATERCEDATRRVPAECVGCADEVGP